MNYNEHPYQHNYKEEYDNNYEPVYNYTYHNNDYDNDNSSLILFSILCICFILKMICNVYKHNHGNNNNNNENDNNSNDGIDNNGINNNVLLNVSMQNSEDNSLRYSYNSITMDEVQPYQECCICLDPFNDDDKLIKLRCSHIYHKECFEEWIKNQKICPYCRLDV